MKKNTLSYEEELHNGVYTYLKKYNAKLSCKDIKVLVDDDYKVHTAQNAKIHVRVYYKDEYFCGMVKHLSADESIKFICSSMWLMRKLFNIVCKLKRVSK